MSETVWWGEGRIRSGWLCLIVASVQYCDGDLCVAGYMGVATWGGGNMTGLTQGVGERSERERGVGLGSDGSRCVIGMHIVHRNRYTSIERVTGLELDTSSAPPRTSAGGSEMTVAGVASFWLRHADKAVTTPISACITG